ncbi:AraC-like ligand-binding domain-containing protein [Lichenifustis flavocetrariae]|uniref:Helix-turn-helix domain-containing protein n=1 Tax=Lichenifustis flavocetrariae TaxID=2949735 RepID=A0AA41YYK6_9HYPH|nr:helix-turn-helix domain-containing protein [Lichenifustis flavocetrariae]MCW6509675.1 helix-turn-helix domain-containing protein [Lichenifustis flavocetrariae]
MEVVTLRATYSSAQTARDRTRSFWEEAVAAVYFPLELQFENGREFAGKLDTWSLGQVSVSRNVSDGLLYRRHARHLAAEREESFLITIPERNEIRFSQAGQEVRCRPGACLVERSHLPYEFSHRDPTSLWVLKIPNAQLKARVARPERLATLQFDVTGGVGALFVDMLRLSVERLDGRSEAAQSTAGWHLIDLLALTIGADDRVLGSQASSIRNAHLHRSEHFIRARLADARLSPQAVADHCGISLRYLHRLFEEEGTTVCDFIRTERLLACDAMLRDPLCRKSIAEIAYGMGFSDQAQFSRHYRARFGCTPREARAMSRFTVQ